jgi:hypothetical protein
VDAGKPQFLILSRDSRNQAEERSLSTEGVLISLGQIGELSFKSMVSSLGELLFRILSSARK